eukprot:12277392-Heterocapsa_arctica.AAC.1
MTLEQRDQLTKWILSLPQTSPIIGFPVLDEEIFTMEEMEHTVEEKDIQLQCYDALIGGFHGTKCEKTKPGYRFELE